MSTSVSKSINIAYGNSTTYMSASSSSISLDFSSGNMICFCYGGETLYATLKTAALNLLYPNTTASPYQSSGDYNIHSNNSSITEYVNLQYNSTNVKTASTKSTTYQAQSFTSTASAVTSSTKNSTIRLVMYMSSIWMRYGYVSHLNLTHYFYRYDFSASRGTGISSATAVNTTSTSDAYNTATGFNGDTITFTATASSGYEFTGWYNGSTLVSTSNPYTVTVSSADVSLTAKAEISTSIMTATYNGAILTDFTHEITPPTAVGFVDFYETITPIVATYNSGIKTLLCANKICSTQYKIRAGNKTLQCCGKVFSTNIRFGLFERFSNMLSTSSFSLSNVTYDSTVGGYAYSTGCTAMLQQTGLATPTAGHIYYGACMQKRPSGCTAADSRFEYYYTDSSTGKITFCSLGDVADDNEWHLSSNRLSLESVTSGSWRMRSFMVNATATVYRKNMLIVDLTAQYGSGNEPSKEECDELYNYAF